jgi:2,3,4,5-tetrahydropyridine-2-carboxylate N-succinyltransferase
MTQDFISHVYDTPDLFAKLSDTEKTRLTNEVEAVVLGLDCGQTTVVQKQADGKWLVNASAKKAILLYFRLQKMELIEVGPFHFVDKIPLKNGLAKKEFASFRTL